MELFEGVPKFFCHQPLPIATVRPSPRRTMVQFGTAVRILLLAAKMLNLESNSHNQK
jgi:hypothetical protein